MKFSKLISFLLSLFFLAACGKEPAPEGFGPDPLSVSTTKSRSVLSYSDHAKRDKNARKKYFLIAGGRDDANFAQEIIQQKNWLMVQGVPEAQITCFYSIPFDKAFQEDEAQYRSLATSLKSCYPAYPKFVWEQMQDGGKETDAIYVYTTSHGMPLLSTGIQKWDLTVSERNEYQSWLRDFPRLDQFMVSLDAFEDGSPGWLGDRVNLLKKGGHSLEDLFFTPRHLKQALNQVTTPTAKKNIVVQACYSGGFIDTDDAVSKADTLQSLQNVTVMTAARYDRASFGCGAGFFRTYFGGAFNDVVMAKNQLPKDFDWRKIYEETNGKVKVLENEYYLKLSDDKKRKFQSSEPMFFMN